MEDYSQQPPPALIVLGPTGVGKSAFCNILTGDCTKSKFPESAGITSFTYTTTSLEYRWFGEPEEPKFLLVDTPGIADTESRDDSHISKLIDLLKKTDRISALALVFNSQTPRIEEPVKRLLRIVENVFAGDIFKHCILVFTHWGFGEADRLVREENSVDEYTKAANYNEILGKEFCFDPVSAGIPCVFTDNKYNSVKVQARCAPEELDSFKSELKKIRDFTLFKSKTPLAYKEPAPTPKFNQAIDTPLHKQDTDQLLFIELPKTDDEEPAMDTRPRRQTEAVVLKNEAMLNSGVLKKLENTLTPCSKPKILRKKENETRNQNQNRNAMVSQQIRIEENEYTGNNSPQRRHSLAAPPPGMGLSTPVTPVKKDGVLSIRSPTNFMNPISISTNVFTLPDGSQYQGSFFRGKFHGYGSLQLPNGDKYEGNWDSGKQHGKGLFVWKNGARYEGDWINGEQTGQANYLFQDGAKYTGGFLKGARHGFGKLNLPNGESYEGSWQENKKHGRGLYLWTNGDSYDGNWLNDEGSGEATTKSADGTVYTGNFVKGMRHGFGTLTKPNGDSYEGNWEANTQHGKGTFNFVNGDRYVGDWVFGECTGNATTITKDGSKYFGGYQKGKRHGHGMFCNVNGDRYEGNWSEGKEHGKGVFTGANGSKYEGDFMYGECTGKGRYTYLDGSNYFGMVVKGERHGLGTLWTATKDTYDGNWVHGKRNGSGTCNWADGSKYEGSWLNDELHGEGSLFAKDGSKYFGLFSKGKRHGVGTYWLANGDKYEGNWENDQKHGRGVYTWKTGARFDGNWLYDQPA